MAGLIRDGRPPTARCGEPSGYARHRRLGEEVCEACRGAYNEYQRVYQRRYRAEKKREAAQCPDR